MSITFEWDDNKNEANKRKHGISFEQAIDAYLDPFAITFPDDRHVEDRMRLIGSMDDNGINVLLVVYIAKSDDLVRFISARHATQKERKAYESRTF